MYVNEGWVTGGKYFLHYHVDNGWEELNKHRFTLWCTLLSDTNSMCHSLKALVDTAIADRKHVE